MRSDYTHITLVCDRSGSMDAVRADAEGAVNHFVARQQAQPGDCTLLLADFDAPSRRGQADANWFTIRHDGALSATPRYELVPRGGTALLDAVGRAIDLTGTRLTALPDAARPAHVVFVVQTDGEENSSTEWTSDAVRRAVARQRDVYSWQFVFLGTAPDAWEQGDLLGFDNVVRAAASPAAFRRAFDDLEHATSEVRGGRAARLAMPNAVIDADGQAGGRPSRAGSGQAGPDPDGARRGALGGRPSPPAIRPG